MANNIHELAQEAFDSGNYQLALELFEHLLRCSDKLNTNCEYIPLSKTLISIDTYIGYGNALARCGRIRESFSVFSFICNQLGYLVPIHRLKHLTIGLLESFTSPLSLKVRQRHLSELQLPPQQKQLPQKHQHYQQSHNQMLPNVLSTQQNDANDCAKSLLNKRSFGENNRSSNDLSFCSNDICGQQQQHHHQLEQSQPQKMIIEDLNINQKFNCEHNKLSVDPIVTQEFSYQLNNDHSNIFGHNESIDDKMDFSDDQQQQQQHQPQPKQQHRNSIRKSASTTNEQYLINNRCTNHNCTNDIDPLLCSMCAHVLLYPVTMSCGHTFCRNCAYNETQCQVCDKRFLANGDSLKQDVLISRLVEKWWMPYIQAEAVNDKTKTLLRQNAFDEALKSCNDSLEQCPKNYEGLLLRSEVLYRLSHFRSSLADAENAIKCRPTAHKTYLQHAQTLNAMGFVEDAIISYCLCVYFNRNPSTFSTNNKLEVAKLIQKLIMGGKQGAKSDDTCIMKNYFHRYHLRTLKHFPQLYSDEFLQAVPMNQDDDEFYSDLNGSLKSTRSNQYRQLERDIDCSSYKKSMKLLKASKKTRRKQYDLENDDKHNEIVYLNRLAENVFAKDSMAQRLVGVSEINKKISNLFDRIHQEISNAKQTQASSFLEVQPSLIDLSDFDCVLCYRTLWKPVVTPCGHTYCMVCLDRCMDYSSCCPLCKTSLIQEHPHNRNNRNSLSPGTNQMFYRSSKKSITRFIEIAMQRFIPLAYRKRQLLEIEKEPSVPVFICTTAYPNVPCPLYVYEPRHRLMIRRAIESGQRQFGIVQPQANGGYSDFGTILNIQDCVLLSNGCSILSTIGYKRFKVIERNEKDGYDTAKVEYICDEAISEDRLQVIKIINETIYKKAIEWYNSLPSHIHAEIHKSFGSMPLLQENLESIVDGPSWAWYIIALLPLNQNLKVEILATTDLEKRLRAIDKTLEYVAAQQRRSVCVVSCEGVEQCQAVDCCIRATSSSQLDDGFAPNAAQTQVTDYLL